MLQYLHAEQSTCKHVYSVPSSNVDPLTRRINIMLGTLLQSTQRSAIHMSCRQPAVCLDLIQQNGMHLGNVNTQMQASR